MLSRQYAKVCDLRDFDDPALARAIADVAPALAQRPPHRKGWEYAMGALFLEETGHLDESSEVLNVGAGSDPILYWLANRTGRTVAVDIYGEGAFAYREGSTSMLDAPEAHAPYPYARDRLEVRSMDARELDFPDASFDAVVSFSSIEHFGGPSDIARAAREIGRVLRPGGHALVVTELFVDYGLAVRPAVQFAMRAATLGRRCSTATPRRRSWPEVFTARELRSRILHPSGLELMQPLDTGIGPETRTHVQSLAGDETDGSEAAGPHVLLAVPGCTFTSAALPLAKPA